MNSVVDFFVKYKLILIGIVIFCLVFLLLTRFFSSVASTLENYVLQNDWSGGESAEIIDSADGWSYFSSSDSIDTSASGQLSLAKSDNYYRWGSNPVKASPNAVDQSKIVSIDSGRKLLVWQGYDDGSGQDVIKAQVLNNNGDIQWPQSGIIVGEPGSGENPSVSNPSVAFDGSGSAIIAWQKTYSVTVGIDQFLYVSAYIQKIDLNTGERLWENGLGSGDFSGIEVFSSQALSNYMQMRLLADENGDTVIVWSVSGSILAQKIGSDGSKQWSPEGGVAVLEYESSNFLNLVQDNEGNIILTWLDARDPELGMNDSDIYMQKISIETGESLWATDGVFLTRAYLQGYELVQLAINSFGEIFVPWSTDFYKGVPNPDIFMQKINPSDGSQMWGPIDQTGFPGRAVSLNYYGDYSLKVAIGSDDNPIVVWNRNSYGSSGGDNKTYDIYMQKLDRTSGSRLWRNSENNFDGVTLTEANQDQSYPCVTRDSAGNIIVVWNDTRNNLNGDIYAQKINSLSGELMWESTSGSGDFNGVMVGNRLENGGIPSIYDSVDGDSIVVWADSSGWDGTGIYAQKIGDRKYLSSGSLISSVLDAGEGSTWGTLDWTEEYPLPTESSIKAKTRTSNNNIDWSQWSAEKDLVAASGSFKTTSPLGRYLQYEVLLSTASDYATPVLNSIKLNRMITVEVPEVVAGSSVDLSATTMQIIAPSEGIITGNGMANSVSQTIGDTSIVVTKAVNLVNSTVPGGDIVLSQNTSSTSVQLNIPDETVVYSNDSWGESGFAGEILPPQTVAPAGANPSGFKVDGQVFFVGAPDTVLIFSNPVAIIFPGSAGKQMAYKPSGSDKWILIGNLCDGTYSSPESPIFPGGCYIDNGVDVKIYTYHLTEFAPFSPVYPPAYSAPQAISEEISEEVPTVETPTSDEPLNQSYPGTTGSMQLFPIPEFNPEWGVDYPGGRVNWALAHRENIYRAYWEILNRTPSVYEVNWWLQYSSDIDLIRYLFLTSEEYLSKNR